MKTALFFFCFALFFVACTDRDRVGVHQESVSLELPVDLRRKVDLLLVVDDSPTMVSKHFALYQGLRGLREVFEDPRFNIDYQVSIVASRAGELQRSGECRERRTQLHALIPSPLEVDDWSCAAVASSRETQARAGKLPGLGPGWHCFQNMRAAGCGRNELLLAASRALQEHGERWRRQGALLGLLMVSDDRDCSAAPSSLRKQSRREPSDDLSCSSPNTAFALMELSGFKSLLRESQPPGSPEAMLAIIAGASDEAGRSGRSGTRSPRGMGCFHWDPAHQPLRPDASWRTAWGDPRWLGALDPGRLGALGQALSRPGEQGLFSICDGDLRRPLSRIAEQLAARLPPICVPGFRAPIGEESEPYRLSCLLEGQSQNGRAVAIPECQRELDSGLGAYRFDGLREQLLPPAGNEQCFVLRSDRSGEETTDPMDDMSPLCRARGAASELWIQGALTRTMSSMHWTLRCLPVSIRGTSRPLASGLLSPVRRFGRLLGW